MFCLLMIDDVDHVVNITGQLRISEHEQLLQRVAVRMVDSC